MIISTFSNYDEATKMIRQLLQERLIACANIIPEIKSFYWWNDKIEEESELIVLMKTRKELERKVIEKIESLHSYDVPAIYAVDSMTEISAPYLQWINEETQQ